MTRVGLLLAAAIAASPAGAHAATGDLRLHRLHGVLTRADLRALRHALDETHRRHEVVLLEIDSPGGSLALGESAMIATLFSGAPVVAFVPDGARASGAATFALMAAGLIVVGPRVRLGTRTGLGRDAELRLGPFGTRLFDAAQAARSGAVDWLVVSLHDGSEVDGRGAMRRGIAAALARDATDAARRLRGRSISIPLTGERVRLTGRLAPDSTSVGRALASHLRRLELAIPLACASIVLFALLPGAWPSWRFATLIGALFAIAVGALRDVPVSPIAAASLAVSAIGVWASPHAWRWLVAPTAMLFGLACATFVDVSRDGVYLAGDAGPSLSTSVIVAVAIGLVAAVASWRGHARVA